MMQAMHGAKRLSREETTISGHDPGAGRPVTASGATLARAVALIEAGSPRAADLLLTGELLRNPSDSDLWLAAGLARMQRGFPASAAAAFRMCHWLSGDELAEDLIAALA